MPFLPSLYNIDKKGKQRVWSCSYDGDKISRLYGESEGVLTESSRMFSAKNVGRKNETSAEEQAHQEALCEWVEHFDKGYVPEPSDAEGVKLMKRVTALKKGTGGTNGGIALALRLGTDLENDDGGETTVNEPPSSSESKTYLPMHCTTYTEEPKVLKLLNLERGVYVQPKIDGVRAIASYNSVTGEVSLMSRQGKPIVHLEKLKSDLKTELFVKAPTIVFDGELYAHHLVDEKGNEIDKDDKFNIISGACRPVRKQPHPLENQIGYHIFDIVSSALGSQEERFKVLSKIFDGRERHLSDFNIHLVKWDVAKTVQEIYDAHDKYAYQNYEGVVIRTRDLTYENDHRSLKMRKYKHFSDAEYTIVGAECDDGVDSEFFTWKCRTTKGDVFNVKPSGTREFRRSQYAKFLESPRSFIGKKYTVKYQNLSPDGVPRFPVGVAVRDYE